MTEPDYQMLAYENDQLIERLNESISMIDNMQHTAVIQEANIEDRD